MHRQHAGHTLLILPWTTNILFSLSIDGLQAMLTVITANIRPTSRAEHAEHPYGEAPIT